MRLSYAALVLALSFVTLSCGPSTRGGPDGGNVEPDSCTGFDCRIAQCSKNGLPETTLTGTVFAPNGTLALYGATVYIPYGDPGPIADGVACSRCQADLPGGAIDHTITDEHGKFTLTRVPGGRNVPLVIQIGKWRRQVVIPEVTDCQENPLAATHTSLPRNKNEGDIPRFAVATGSCDALECLLRRIGIDDREFTTSSGDGRVHLYRSNGASMLYDQTPLPPASELWGNLEQLKRYDVVLYSCECNPYPEQKPQAMMDILKQYADLGGRVFLSHYHSVWVVGERGVPTHAPAVWPAVASCPMERSPSGSTAAIDTVNNPKGVAFSAWMASVAGTSGGSFPITEVRQMCDSVDNTRAERWLYLQSSNAPQTFQFTTPNEAPEVDRCGKVVFSDMHVASGSSSGTTFPNGCATGALTAQEKALAFMVFDISTCVGPIF